MNGVLTPVDLLEDVLKLRLPPGIDRRLQDLMDKNNLGELTLADRQELTALVQWSEAFSLVNARVLRLIGRSPMGSAD